MSLTVNSNGTVSLDVYDFLLLPNYNSPFRCYRTLKNVPYLIYHCPQILDKFYRPLQQWTDKP